MTAQENSSDFNLLAAAADYIKPDFEHVDPEWRGSPFAWVRRLPPGSKGKIGKLLVQQWCGLKGLSVDRSPDSDADMLVNGHRVEVKFSTLWKSGEYRFQQIRDQEYEYAVCLGISPSEAHCWVISKDILRDNVIGHTGQHTGSTGQDTAWIKIKPSEPPEWLENCGGTLEQAFIVLNRLSKR
jgi:hypothetical protein